MVKIDSAGKRLRAFRSERGLSGQALADAIDSTKSTVSYWEAEKTPLPWVVCLALETAYGVCAKWLATGEGPMWAAQTRRKPKAVKGLHLVPLLDANLGFGPDGSVIEPHPDAPMLGFPHDLLEEILGKAPVALEHLYLWRAEDAEMSPRIQEGAWVLLDTSDQACEHLIDHDVYLVELGETQKSCLRRVATEPTSGDLLVAADAPGRVPLRVHRPSSKGEVVVLAHALWTGGTLSRT